MYDLLPSRIVVGLGTELYVRRQIVHARVRRPQLPDDGQPGQWRRVQLTVSDSYDAIGIHRLPLIVELPCFTRIRAIN